MEWSIAIMGLMVGLLVGMTGVGGASLLTPLLIMLNISPTVAVATDLFYNSITKFFGSIQHFRQKTIDFKLVKFLAIGSIPGAVAAILLLELYPPLHEIQETVVKHMLGFVLIIVALASIAKQWFGKLEGNRWQSMPLSEKRGMTILIGTILGFIVGMTSIGSGSLFALAMMLFYRMGAAKLVGTDIAHAFFLVTAAGILHAGFGNINYGLAFNLLLGSVPGVIAGSSLSAKLPAKPLRTFVAAIILVSGIKLI